MENQKIVWPGSEGSFYGWLINVLYSMRMLKTKEMLQCYLLRLVLFNTFINDLEETVVREPSRLQMTQHWWDQMLSLRTKSSYRDISDRMELTAYRNHMKFSKDECKVLHMERNNPLHPVQAGD